MLERCPSAEGGGGAYVRGPEQCVAVTDGLVPLPEGELLALLERLGKGEGDEDLLVVAWHDHHELALNL